MVVGGASLEDAATIEFAAANLVPAPDDGDSDGCVRGAVLIDAEGFVDGIVPIFSSPRRWPARALLRDSANEMSYFDPDTYATNNALQICRLHCLWER